MSNILIRSVLVFYVIVLSQSSVYSTEQDDTDTNAGKTFDLLNVFRRIAAKNRGSVKEPDEFENWKGRWFPERPEDPSPPPKVLPKSDSMNAAQGEMHGSSQYSMGDIHGCDDGKTNLTVDWNNSPVNYTCYGKKIIPEYSIKPLDYCEHVPEEYQAIHKCMNETIQYDDDIPIYGTHRPVWPVYGEYKFLPKQRWLHSLEHGAVVMLYHPCANPLEVQRLRTLVTGCLRRHVITPYNFLDEDRPLALVTWGCRMSMSYVNPSVVKYFIKKRALRGPEEISREGSFEEGLLRKAAVVTDEDDTTLCFNM